MTHFVYPYIVPYEDGPDRLDLFYSLLSIKKYFKGPYDITIIGEIPDYVDRAEVKFIALPQKSFADINVTISIIEACKYYERFVLMNDDMIFLNDISIIDFEVLYYERTHIADTEGNFSDYGITYSNILKDTYHIMKNDIDEFYVFGVHIPNLINSKMYMELIHHYNILDLASEGKSIINIELYKNVYKKFLNQYFEMKYPNEYRVGFWDYNDPENEEILKSGNYNYKVLNTSDEGYQRHPFLIEFLKETFT